MMTQDSKTITTVTGTLSPREAGGWILEIKKATLV